jgi:DNA-3-methyladenine glycosylase
LGITTGANATNLHSNSIWIAEYLNINTTNIIASPRVGIDYAGEDAKLPYRFRIKNNLYTGK